MCAHIATCDYSDFMHGPEMNWSHQKLKQRQLHFIYKHEFFIYNSE